MVRTRGIASLALTSLVVVACGGDDGSNGGTGGTVAATGAVGGTVAATGGTGATGGTVAGTAGTTAGTGPTFVPGSPTFTAIFQEIILPNGCGAGAFCHGGTLGQANLLLTDQATAHAQLVGIAAMGAPAPPPGVSCTGMGLTRVVAGDPDASLLVKKLEGTQTCGTPMPPPPAPLIDAMKQAQVRQWITNGALND